jgi:hypothetical protein
MAAAMEAVTEAFTFTRLVGVLAISADKDAAAILDELEPVVSDLVVTRNSSPRSMEVTKLTDLAEAVFGQDRVYAAPRLDEAIDVAVTLADEAGAGDGRPGALLPGAAGVLITGSVITAGDARALLVPAGHADDLGQPAAPERGVAGLAEPDPAEQDPGDLAEPDLADRNLGEPEPGEPEPGEPDLGGPGSP